MHDYLMMPSTPAIAIAVRNLDGRTPQVVEALDGDLIEQADSSIIADALTEVLPELRRMVRARIEARRRLSLQEG